MLDVFPTNGLQVKAGVGATGTMLFLDTQSNRCHIARLGKSMPFATARKGVCVCTCVFAGSCRRAYLCVASSIVWGGCAPGL